MTHPARTAVRSSSLAVALALGLILAGLGVARVGAYSIVTETGMVGHWSLTDTMENPGATCKYGPEYPPDYAGLRWITVRPPTVFAADRDSNKVDHKRVKWFWKLQRGHYPELNWKTIKTSAVQSAIAYDNQAAPFSALRINHNVGNPDIAETQFRAQVVIKWVRADGSVEGTAKATIDWYLAKAPWGDSVRSSWCQKVTTAG